WQFGKLAAWRLVQVRAGVIARADRKSRFLLEYVHFGAMGIQLMPALEDAAAAAQHLVAAARGGGGKMMIALVIFDWGGIGRPRERAGHPYVLITAVNSSVTSLAPPGVDIGGRARKFVSGPQPADAPCACG